MLNKSISVIKYFISAAVWVHWAMYWDFKKNYQVSLSDPLISDTTVTTEADAMVEETIPAVRFCIASWDP